MRVTAARLLTLRETWREWPAHRYAIPAVLIFNFLSAKITGLEATLTRSVGELLDEMENRHGRRATASGFEEKAA